MITRPDTDLSFAAVGPQSSITLSRQNGCFLTCRREHRNIKTGTRRANDRTNSETAKTSRSRSATSKTRSTNGETRDEA